jgi:hypothetical protein
MERNLEAVFHTSGTSGMMNAAKSKNPRLWLLGSEPDRDSTGLIGNKVSLALAEWPVNSYVIFSEHRSQI